jgi:EAL domain-containing protein (putative c-di-GMP-specific phosphodiesterase class I)
MTAEAAARRGLEIDLRNALTLGQMSVVYQPQFNVRTQTVNGFEALLRWDHPVRGAVPPSVFAPVAEAIGCAAALNEWALITACQEAALWPPGLTLAVTVSAHHTQDSEHLFRAVQAALEVSGLDPKRLELGITERSLLSQEGQAMDALHRLRARGIHIAMDDFGAGHASLGQLRTFPFARIRIDRSFIGALGHGGDAAAVVRAIAGMGAGLGMAITAKGVETAEQAAVVEADGCTDIQGPLVSRPVAAAEIGAVLYQCDRSPGHVTEPDR